MKPIATDNYDFESLIKGGCVYVDKTDMLWKLASSKDALYFIARPRRFGKSLMLSTFKYLFQGKKELFRGLKIEKKKWDWSKTYPVIELNIRKTSAPTIGALDAWRDANSSTSTLNACAIDASSIPHKFWYWDETSGVPVWTNAVKGVQSW